MLKPLLILAMDCGAALVLQIVPANVTGNVQSILLNISADVLEL